MILPVGSYILGQNSIVVGVPAAAQKFLRCIHTVMDGELFVRVGIRHQFEQEADGVGAALAVLAHSLCEVCVQGVVGVCFVVVV